ncbi:uncharacterized protein LOC116341177 [Contarinia nasturtii]|uniref:uncharacterized protein LOC116341177 n=1 Tax=Contarinia nasturtii TaxID=265458 RepID=UPI0012D402C2|nr:uncharacterized protein LOC116341177 [Contarinia nasturtii]XP_031623955.1 uncharacterized protein LOC116341177 [Contarinia nasturtii]
MALLQVRHGVGTFYTLRLLFLSTIIIICTEPLSGNAFLSSGQGVKGPDPQIRLVVHPNKHVIIPVGSFVLLHCEANFTDNSTPNDESDYENDEPFFPDESDFIQNDEASDYSNHQEENTATNVCQQEVQYQWLRDDRPINDTLSSYIQTFCNGTIKIAHSTIATAIYRCVAKTTKPDIGAIISKASKVETAVLERKFDNLKLTAELGSSLVLNCAIESIPTANIQWYFNNGTNINLDVAERYFQLNNGSLLIVNVMNQDYQTFRCSARNEFYKDRKHIQFLLEVTHSITANNPMLLPPLQNQDIFIANGQALNLYCALTSMATSRNAIRWTFTSRTEKMSSIELVTQNPYKLHIANTSVEKNDGIYRCHFGDEYQTFDVTITTPPVIHDAFTSKEGALGFYVKLNCNVTSNPKATVQWYRDGKLIEYDWIVRPDESKLLIQTYEEKDKGIYQCVATNVAGEVHATGLMSLKPKQHMDPPKNPKCFPLNLTTFKVTFDGPQYYRWSAVTYYVASKRSEPYWYSKVLHDENTRVQNTFTVTDKRRPPFEPVMVYFRGMERISSADTGGKVKSVIYDLSRLSEGVKCATQGLPISGMFSPSGIFIWWSKKLINATKYIIQFQSDEMTSFSNQIVGTTQHIDYYQSWNDTVGDLTNISVTTNIYPYTELDDYDDRTTQTDNNEMKTNSKMLTELRVDGNVSGILIPNTHEIIVRVLVPIIDDDGELIQDVRFVEWKKIEDTSRRMTKFKIWSIGINQITFQSMDPRLRCVQICYLMDGEQICDDKSIENSFVDVVSLKSYTAYTFLLFKCSETETLFNKFEIQTNHDIPGSVTNHTIYKDKGIVIEWGPPTKANGILEYYLIKWTIANTTHEKHIPYQSEIIKNEFKFPGQESDRFNISIQAVSNFGVGIPIYVDLREMKEIPSIWNINTNTSKYQDPRLGISIGVLLSVICVVVCALIIVRHRRCSKSPHHQHINGNGNNTRNSFQSRSPIARGPVVGATTKIPTSSAQISANCTNDAHEMQTLIVTPSLENIQSLNGNGLQKKQNNQINGIIVRSHNHNNTNAHSDNDDENIDLSRCGLISSTPKSNNKTMNNDHLKNTSTNHGSNTANSIDLPYQRIDHNIEAALGADTAPNNILCNGSMKNMLPPNKSVHSILYNNETEIPPIVKRSIQDDKSKSLKRTSAHKSNVSIFDDIQQSLLPESANGTESSSASTSSGSVPMDRIANKTNCLFDLNTFDNNGTPHSIVENQRYMRSAALV